jgi:pimeloyl-ACP methyl ester carboxylesterase
MTQSQGVCGRNFIRQSRGMERPDHPSPPFTDRLVPVSAGPAVQLFTTQVPGPADRTLLVIHGGPDWDHSYLRQPLARLSPGHRVIWADLRGCGRSTQGLDDGQYNPDAATADLIALLGALGIARADVLGFSYGGMIAARLALAAPGRVRRLIVASASLLPVPPDAFAGWREREERQAAEAAVWSDPSLSGPDLARAAAIAGAPANVWRAEALPGYLQVLAGVRFAAEWLRPYQAGTLPPARPDHAVERLAALGLPVLLLQGRQDMGFPATLTAEAAGLIPDARAVILDEAGHMAHVDQPEAWLAAVADFLTG